MRGRDFVDSERRSVIMRRVQARDTDVELRLQAELRKRRIRFEVDVRDLPGKPDIVLRRARLAVFVDGDLWHAGQWRRRGLLCLEEQFRGAANSAYWVRKIQRNAARDLANIAQLLADDWTVLRLWGSDVATDPARCAEMVLAARKVRSGNLAARLAARTVISFSDESTPAVKKLAEHGWRPMPADACEMASLMVSAGLGNLQRVLELQPPLVLWQLTMGAKRSPSSADLGVALCQLAELGYGLDAFEIDDAHFVPERQPRTFVLAIHSACGAMKDGGSLSARELPADDELRPRRIRALIRKYQDLPWQLRRLPPLPRRRRSPPPRSAAAQRRRRACAVVWGWIADRYLNPLVTESLHGRPLRL